ncbi:MCT family MFS transporter [Lachancea thermotolerans CBS 6340]|uniref:KLTH0D00396p n=1 Tax=Lachancea thermotolerans (strain ATCC 56472 / CBS 6340 / NRRL Y-8284) TaxID=559295 RepID=C5DFW1_LACTC|nr:KLTH0D00396p [Lachancea thermotolerans CBS 6340]CAR22303.1 KLTH0D00396p [Lachancea thermotolerans CBS 6340]
MLMPSMLQKPTRAFLHGLKDLRKDHFEDSRFEAPTTSGYEGSAEERRLFGAELQAKRGNVQETPLSNELVEEIEIFEQEGGFQAWLVVFGSFMGLIPVFGTVNSLGAIESYISKHQLASESSTVVSWIFSIYLSLTFSSCIIAGGYFDRNGGRDPLCVGTILFTGAIIATADCKTVWQFILAFSVLGGISSGILMTPLVSCVATWFLKKRGLATSIATIGGSVGGVIFPVMLRSLYSKVGFSWALRILALICFSCLACSIIFARERQKPESKPFHTKTEAFKWYLNSSLNWRYFLDWKFLFASLGMGFAENSLTASSTYLASYSLARGNSEEVSYALIATTNAVGIFGRYIPGYLADRWTGRFNMVIITVSLAAFFNLVMWLPFGGNVKVLWAYSILYGFTTGTILSLPPVCIGQISRTTDFGKRYSSAYFLEALMTIPVIPVGGAIIGSGKISNYNDFIVYSSMMMIAASICFIISRSICTGFRMCKF